MLGFSPLGGAPLGDDGDGGGASGTYTLACDAGYFNLQLRDNEMLSGRIPVLEPGHFTLTGALLGFPKVLALSPGVFTLSIVAAVRKQRTLNAQTGAFTLSLTLPSYVIGYVVNLDTGGFNLNLHPPVPTYNRGVIFEPLSYALTLPLLQAHRVLTLVPEPGVFGFSGGPVSYSLGYTMLLQGASFRVTGGAITMQRNRAMGIEGATFILSGKLVTARVRRQMAVATTNFNFDGQAATLQRTRRLPEASRAIGMTGGDVAMRIARTMRCEPGRFGVTGSSATARRQRHLDLQPGGFGVTVAPTIFETHTTLALTPAAFGLTGGAVSMQHRRQMELLPGHFRIDGVPLDLAKAAPVDMLPLRMTTNIEIAPSVPKEIEPSPRNGIDAEPGVFQIITTQGTLAVHRVMHLEPGGFGMVGADK